MKSLKIILLAVILLAAAGVKAETSLPSSIVLTPYVVADATTPCANKILKDKLTRIVSEYGVNSENGVNSPFIITAHAIELDRETTRTAPARTVVRLSLTIYLGNGEEGLVFASCNQELKGIGSDVDDAYSSAMRKLDVKDPLIADAIGIARDRITEYYTQKGPALIKQSKILIAAGNYAEAYGVLLHIPSVCPQYEQACDLLLATVQKESAENNNRILDRARSAWSANPTESGASEATALLGEIENATPELRREMKALQKEMATRLQSNIDAERAAQEIAEKHSHAERMAEIRGATKVAVARAKQPVYYYHIRWW